MVLSKEKHANNTLSPELLRDLRIVAAVEPAAAAGFAEALHQELSAMIAERLPDLAKQFFNEGAIADSFIRAIECLRPPSTEQVSVLTDLWRRASERRADLFSEAEYAAFERNIMLMVKSCPALAMAPLGGQFGVCDAALGAPAHALGVVQDETTERDEVLDDWRTSPEEILAKMQNASNDDDQRFDAILFAEIAKFDETQAPQLLEQLFAFVAEHRFSQDDYTKTIVGSAIRKLAMNLSATQIEQYADLFLPTETDALPCEVELELAKAVIWRLTASPKCLTTDFPQLEARLTELASDYLKRRLILQKNYASVALNAILGVLLLDGQDADVLVQRIRELNIGWFFDLFQRRLERLCAKLMDKGDAASQAVAKRLSRFTSKINDVSTEGMEAACQHGD